MKLMAVWLILALMAQAEEVRMRHVPPLANTVCGMQLYGLAQILESNYSFYTGRTLRDYYGAFGAGFLRSLRELRPEDTWLDSGSGAGYAVGEYQVGKDIARDYNRFSRSPHRFLGNRPRAKTLGITVALPEAAGAVTEAMEKSGVGARHRNLSGRYLEDIPAEEFGKVQLITDFFGPLAYTSDVTAVMNRYLEITGDKANLYFQVAEAKTFVRGKDGLSYTLETYLAKVLQGHEFTNLGPGEPIHIKISAGGPKRIPHLRLVELRSDSPPFRIFEELSE